MQILHLDSSILGGNSASRLLSAATVDQLAKAAPGLDIVYRDLASEPLAHLSGEHLAARQGAVPETPATQKEIAASQAVLDEFLGADIVVIGAPMYNFGIPSQLKAWIDRILVAGKTFRYGAAGPEGLAGSKRVIVVTIWPAWRSLWRRHAGGGLRTRGIPICGECSRLCSASPIRNIVVAEGLQIGPEQREKAMRGPLALSRHGVARSRTIARRLRRHSPSPERIARMNMLARTPDTVEVAGRPRAIIHRTRGRAHGSIVRLVSPSDIGELIKPFVFLDYFETEPAQAPAFGLHPHSGIATLTLLLNGQLWYEETTGVKGVIAHGGIEWI